MFKVGPTRDFKPADSMLRNLSGSNVTSDLLLLEDAPKNTNTKYLGSLAST
jgi:hypothetical protein